MNCKNCGTPLTGTEIVCPNCGTPLASTTPVVEPEILSETPTVQPVVEPTPVVQPTPVVAPTPVVEPAPVEQTPVVAPTPVVESAPVEQTPVVTPTPVTEPTAVVPTAAGETQVPTENKSKDNKTIILIIILVILAVAAVVVYFLVFAGGAEGEEPAPTTPTETPTEVSTKENTETYAGYKFVILDGFTAKTDDNYGLVISDSTVAYSVSVDYSHSYDDYKTALTEKYPDQAGKLVATVEEREYLALILTDTDGSQGTQYITKATDTTTFVGMVVKSDYKPATTVEFSKLTTFIDSAKKDNTSSFAAGDDNDVGKAGIKSYGFTKDNFKFENKED